MSVDNPMRVLTDRLMEDITYHIEAFACAFAKITELPADQIVMCHAIEWRDDTMVNKIWFEKKRTQEAE